MSSYRIIICGQSIFLMSIEVGLAALPEIEVERVTHKPFDQACPERSQRAHDKPDLVEQLLARQPDLIVIEENL